MRRSRALQIGALFLFSCLLIAAISRRSSFDQGAGIVPLLNKKENKLLTKETLSQALGGDASFAKFPTEVTLPLENGQHVPAVVQYAFDSGLQDEMETLLKSYSPDYGAFVAVDATTGQVLSMVSYARNRDFRENFALRATFPSASVFKVVTAAAAIEERNFNSNTLVQFNGQNHTLYKRNILRPVSNRWTRQVTLREAFAKSINTVFGRVGAFTVGPQEMREYAMRFGFNRKISSDIPMQPGVATIPSDDPWGLAEASSGYTRENTMSPLQGALIAAAITNDGIMMEPFIVSSVYTQDGQKVYSAEPKISSVAVDPKTAAEIRSLMRETVANGTSRKSFKGFFRREFADLDVGGKTGSLTGLAPKGKYDWFVGFAQHNGHKIAVSALTIHEKQWRVKSSYLARKAIEHYFSDKMGNTRAAAN